MKHNKTQRRFKTHLSNIYFVLVFSCNRSRVREDGGAIPIRVLVHYVNSLELNKNKTQLIQYVNVVLQGKVDLKYKWRGIGNNKVEHHSILLVRRFIPN